MKAKEIRSMSEEELNGKLTENRDKLFKQRIQKSLGQSDNSNKIRETRKNIAKILTILSEKRSKNGKQKK
jgi:large subunit ribosomal protein L29